MPGGTSRSRSFEFFGRKRSPVHDNSCRPYHASRRLPEVRAKLPWPASHPLVSPQNRRYIRAVKSAIKEKIEAGTFSFLEEFPHYRYRDELDEVKR